MAVLDRPLWDDAVRVATDSRTLPKEVDAVVIGAGITGLTAAYLLKCSGRTVAVFERERVGAGESGRTSAHLTYLTDESLPALVKRFGRDAARLVWEGGAAAIDLIDSNATDRQMTCHFRRVPGFHCARFANAHREDDTRLLAEEAELAHELGFAAGYVERGPIGGAPAVAFADQALFHPVEYLNALARAIEGDESHVYERSEVGHVIQDPLAVVVNGETMACKDVIIATHVPLQGSTGTLGALMFQTKLYPYSTYVVGAPVGEDAPLPGLYSDTSDPYWYLRIHEGQAGTRYAIFGGADHKTGHDADTESHFAAVEAMLRALVPSARIERRWTGQVIETNDGLPYIGATEDHQYVATGYAGNGLTFGTLAGLMLHDAVMGVDNPWRALFDPHRRSFAPGAVARFVGENIDYPYYFIADRLRRRPQGVDALKPGDGRVLTIGGRRVACHRTRSGTLIKLSAVCTHLGCLVRWNAADSTWDCPCHGSRFTPEGLVLGGPAETPLERITD